MIRNELDLNTWNRREHLAFFKDFDEPFFGMVSQVDFTIGYQKAKDLGCSYFLYYLHKSIQAANAIAPFRYRIEEDKVFVYDKIHASPTIGREDHTFGFSFIAYDPSFDAFVAHAEKEIEAVKNSEGIRFNDNARRIDNIHYSSIPWCDFTSITHARHFGHSDSIPKISFGKYTKENNKILLPIGIYVHHGLMDGYHVGLYIQEFQRLLNE